MRVKGESWAGPRPLPHWLIKYPPPPPCKLSGEIGVDKFISCSGGTGCLR